MFGNILSKINGDSGSVETNVIHISSPSIVQLKIAPEQVRTFERDGVNLKMVLLDGKVVVVENFFVKDSDGNRSDLVLEDGSGVLWWGQYPAEWAGFHFTEIEDNSAVIPPWLWAGLGLLGLGGAAAAAGGGGGGDGDSDSNHPPMAGNDTVAGNEGVPVTGNVLRNDSDPDGDPLRVTQFSVDVDGDGKPDSYNAGDTAKISGVGELTLNPDGSYTFTPDPGWSGKVPKVDYTISDGQGGTDSASLDITINGAATITGPDSGLVTEDGGVSNGTAGTSTTGGTLTITDADAGEDHFQTPPPASLDGVYGTFTFDPATGAWTYQLDNTRAVTEALNATDAKTETLTVVSADGTATQTITVTVNGGNDAPTVTSAPTEAKGAVVEEGIDASGDPIGAATATGTLTGDDVDAEDDPDSLDWSLKGSATDTEAGTYGSLTLDADGKWTYTLDDGKADSLNAGDVHTETFTAVVTDQQGATAEQVITVTVTGSNDAPTVTSAPTEAKGAVVEEGIDASGDPIGTATATGTLTGDDVDAEDDTASLDWSLKGSATGTEAGTYGSLTLDADGKWTYTLDEGKADSLNAGDVHTETFTAIVTDQQGATAEQVITVTVTGSNDAPVIDATASTLSGAVTEIADGATGENTNTHSQNGDLHFSDVDDTTGHTADFAPQDTTGYVGTFSLGTVDDTTGKVAWTFKVDDSVLDSWPAGKTVDQKYDVTIADGNGGTVTQTVTVTLNGANDRPEPENDLSLMTTDDASVDMDVLANDNDVDGTEASSLTVIEVDGQSIVAGGSSVDIMDGADKLGEVSLDGTGKLTFTPEPGFSGQITVPYTVDDGSGAGNATATANWVINVVGVDIVDNAKPGDPATGDNVLASIDDLVHTAISGHAPVGGTITGLTVTDGTTTVTVDPATITVNPDGGFSTTADLSGLKEGSLTVKLQVEDADGNPATVTDDILKDTVTEVAIDPLLVVDGEITTITGTGEAGATITLTIDSGTPVNVTVAADGTWAHTPATPLSTPEVTITADAVDKYGNENDANRKIAGLTIEDKETGDDADVLVYESALSDGSNPSAITESATSTFTIGTTEGGIDHIVIGGSVVDGALSGGTTVTLAQLQDIGTTSIPPIATTYGALTITAYDASSGEITYVYALSTNTTAHSDASGNDIVREDIQLAVVDNDGDTRVDNLVVGVVDDVPEAASQANIDVAEGDIAIGYDSSTSTSTGGAVNLITGEGTPPTVDGPDVAGADGARVHEITYTAEDGTSTTVAIADGASKTVDTQYGSLTVHSNGDWSYTSDPSVAQGASTGLSDDFTYTLIDGDGDISNVATQPITVTDTAPALGTPVDGAVSEASLSGGSDADASALTVTGSLEVTKGADAIDTVFTNGASGTPTTVGQLLALGLTSGGEALSYTVSGDGHTLTATAGAAPGTPVFTVTITDPAAASGSPGYNFELQGALDHPAGGGGNTQALDFSFTSAETEVADGDAVTGVFTVTVTDDVPVAASQANIDVAEGDAAIGYDSSTSTSTGGAVNLITGGTTADTPGADGARIHQVRYTDGTGVEQTVTITPPATDTGELITQYGKLTVNADGSWSYTPEANIVHTSGAPVSDLFSYTLIDGDDDVSGWADQPINVTDTAPIAADDTGLVLDEGAAQSTGNVVTNDTASADGGTQIHDFTYTDASGTEQTHTFVSGTDEVTVATPTGDLTVNTDGSWSFTPVASYDHDASGADAAAGGFSYRLQDADGSLSASAEQPITVADTSPTVAAATLGIDEQDIKDTGSAGSGADSTVTENLAITKAEDAISDVVFNAATITGLEGQGLTSGGDPLTYSLSADGHTLTATAGAGGPEVFVLQMNNTGDASGTTQSVSMTQKGPLDHAAGDGTNGANDLSITVGYEVLDIDSAASGSLTLTVTDDVPAAASQANIDVAEGDVAIGYDSSTSTSTGGAVNLITGGTTADTQGADGARVHEITYTAEDGTSTTVAIADGASKTVDTQYGSLTVHSNGDWSYTTVSSANHVKPANDASVEDDFSYTLIDGDGDISNVATQPITVTDTEPLVGPSPADGTVDEAGLPLGSGDPAVNKIEVSGSLDVTPGKDTIDTAFTNGASGTTTTVGQLLALNLKSGGEALSYTVSGDGHTLTATAGAAPGTPVFTVTITDPTNSSAGYTFTLNGPLDHDGAPSLDLKFFDVTVTDSDGDADRGSFTVTVMDDAPTASVAHTVPEDDPLTFNTTADANPDNTTIWKEGGTTSITGTDNGSGGKDYKTDHGTVTVNADGTITYNPDANYSGTETFVYKTQDGTLPTDTKDTTVTMTVNPVSDAPTVSADEASINTLEDTSVALGLNAPVITDATDQSSGTGDDPERLGAITLEGIPDGAVLTAGMLDGTASVNYSATGGSITIVLSDGPTVAGTTGTLTMTRAQFEALQVKPPANTHENFTVDMSVSSYEVDASGNVVEVGGTPVAGAESTAAVDVYVQAATDDAALTFDTSKVSGVDGVVGDVVYGSGVEAETKATVTLSEDTTFVVNDILKAGFADTDGSEVRSITIENTTGHTILVNGDELANGASQTIDALSGTSGQTGSMGSFPPIVIGGEKDFSGDLDGIKITINAQDKDSDGYWDGSSHVPGLVDGTLEADTANNSVTLNVHVNPVAGDVAAADVTTAEDTPVAFLAGVGVTDGGGTGSGTEVIDSVSFEVPTDWVVTAPTSGAGWSVSGTGAAADPYTITFDDSGTVLTEAQRESVLDGFTIRPPAHSSLDATIALSITSTDTNTVGGSPKSNTKTVTDDVKITVTPQAETTNQKDDVPGTLVDTDGGGTADLTMTEGHDYTTAGEEDAWFSLSTDPDEGGSFKLENGWNNEDSSEQTYARLTPELVAGDGSQVTAIGSQFKWTEGGVEKTATYVGEPIDVPVGSLSTLEFKAAPNFSGKFEIKVQAHTIDKDEDGGSTSTETSGESLLTNVLIKPVADEVTLALNGRASGSEDADIPLSIRPTSSDPSETFNITISDIPVGATITYGSGADMQTFTATAGDTGFSIVDFHSDWPLTIRPPVNSNENFKLNVSGQSVDTLDLGAEGGVITVTKDSPDLTIDVAVKGVADAAAVTPAATAPSYTEADLDSDTQSVQLKDLVTIAPVDTDGSEALTVRITGLPEGFSPSVGTLLTGPEVNGGDRIWVLTQDQFDSAAIAVPTNYSGEVKFQVGAVTTENDGNSLTGAPKEVSFTVAPSPEATVTASATLTEDVLSKVDLGIVHQNGDNDETLTAVRIAVDSPGSTFTLYLGDDPVTAKTLAQAFSDGDITKVTDTVSGIDYYLLDAGQIGQLSAKGGADLDGSLGKFDFQYQITDSHYGTTPSGATTGDWQDADFTLTATPVTDAPAVSITGITGTPGTTSAADDVSGDDAVPDTATLTAADTVTVTLNVNSPDADGSEHLVRVVIEGVPEGVTVTDGEFIGGGRWLLVYDDASAKAINGAGGLDLPVEFVVGPDAGSAGTHDITMTVQVRDRGDQADPGTTVESDTVQWHLNTDFTGSGGQAPATIEEWTYNNDHATEDTSFTLSSKITADVTVQSTDTNIFTITLGDLPEGTQVSGMTLTTITEGGVSKQVWSASAVSTAGMSETDIEAMLQTLMDGITITPPVDSNENNAPGDFQFDARLTTSVAGGSGNDTAGITPTMPVDPVTDSATMDIRLDTAVETDELNESDSSIPITLTVSNPADGAAGSIVGGSDGGNLYLQVGADKPGLQDGTLTVDGTTYTLTDVAGVTGIADGKYYVIPDVKMGDTLDLVYTPGTMTEGAVTVDAWVQNVETGGVQMVSTGTGTLAVNMSNDGVAIDNEAVTGSESAATDTTADSLIELPGLSVTLNDDDGSEDIVSILLSGLPDGFLVYTGANAGSATLASNAGGTDGSNTWVVSPDGTLPAYVGIIPPPHWSGTLADLKLLVESGETALSETRVDSHDLGTVTVNPKADGINLTTTKSFGEEGTIVALNLNASMADATDATVKDGSGAVIAQDASTETTTLQITGLGEHASFYVGTETGTELLGSGQVSYDAGTGAYTITGLSQSNLDSLGFMQAQSALTDQDAGTSGMQIGVEAWTVESGTPASESTHVDSTVTLNLSNQLATTGNDSLIWTGNSIDGRSGTDTVHLRQGESLSGTDLAGKLSHIEIIDLGIAGENEITGLTPDQVKAILGSGSGSGTELTIQGGADDSVALDGTWADNGDGTWTGTLGDGTSTITLRVDGVPVDDTLVTPPVVTFGVEGMALMGFSLGLENLQAGDGNGGGDEAAFLFDHDGDPPAWESVLVPTPATGSEGGAGDGGTGDMDDWLPGQGSDGGSTAPASDVPAGDASSAYAAFVPDTPLPDDELQHGLNSAHMVG